VSPRGSAMPLLVLCDPGFAASVGVSKASGGFGGGLLRNRRPRGGDHPEQQYTSGRACARHRALLRKIGLPETRPAQTRGCRSQQLLTSLPRPPRFGWVLRRWPGRRGEHPWGRPRPSVHGAVSSAERTGEMRSERKRAGRERGRRALPGSSSAGRGGGPSPPRPTRRPRAAVATVRTAPDSTFRRPARASRGPRDDHPLAWRGTPGARLQRHLESVGQRGERRVFGDETGAPSGIGLHRAE
jgi:hypothetical protein